MLEMLYEIGKQQFATLEGSENNALGELGSEAKAKREKQSIQEPCMCM